MESAPRPPEFRIVRGEPSAAEVAALVAVLALVRDPAPAAEQRPARAPWLAGTRFRPARSWAARTRF